MKKKVAVLVDGGHLRAMANTYSIFCNPDFIESFCKSLNAEDEEIHKILFYDCRPFNGVKFKPIPGAEHKFTSSGSWLDELSCRDLFAVRLGQLKFRGWVLKRNPTTPRPFTDIDFKPNFEQKGVDTRLGLDISDMSVRRLYDRLLVVSGDSDMIPALKEARKSGVQIALYQLPYLEERAHRDKLKNEMKAHCDFMRNATWPAAFVPRPQPAIAQS